MFRVDYMIDRVLNHIRMIEYNTIAASFGGLSDKVAKLHSFLFHKYAESYPSSFSPENLAGHNQTVAFNIAKAFSVAFELYGGKKTDCAVAFIVQETERNIYDQKAVELELLNHFKIKSIRVSLKELYAKHSLENGVLKIHGKEIAIVYFRAGYAPYDYPSEEEWKAREIIELSRAVKCPNIDVFLSGFKKFQQFFSKPHEIEKLLHCSAKEAEHIQPQFSGMWGLDELEDKDTKEAIQRAIKDPHLFVLKTYREGGGNNYFDQDISDILTKGVELERFLLMEKINPPEVAAYMFKDGVVKTVQSISELGIYGAFIKNKNEVVLDEVLGHLLRTKETTTKEGGVATGYSVIDGAYLIDNATSESGSIELQAFPVSLLCNSYN